MVRAFETDEYSMGSQATMFWLHHFLRYKEDLGAAVENSTQLWRSGYSVIQFGSNMEHHRLMTSNEAYS